MPVIAIITDPGSPVVVVPKAPAVAVPNSRVETFGSEAERILERMGQFFEGIWKKVGLSKKKGLLANNKK